MNKFLKLSISISALLLLLFFVISNTFTMQASADSNNNTNVPTDAVVVSDTSNTEIINEASTVTTRRAPVSIINYSNEVTESSDTYDYSKKQPPADFPNDFYSATPVTTTIAPITNTTTNSYNTPSVTVAPVPTAIPNNSSSNSSNTSITKKIFIGDSRTVGMQSTLGTPNGVVWSCKSSMGLKWMKSTGVPNIESQITNGTAVIILMGVNDLYNTNNYIEYINQKSSNWAAKGAKTYYVSVNPINESSYKGFKNSKIETFNNAMQSGLKNVTYIDTYNYLITHECNYTNDGLHYKGSTSKKIFDLINENLYSQ